MLETYQRQFIEFILKEGALSFGQFIIKSGRQSPYFFNFGQFNHGASLIEVGQFYADALEQSGFEYDLLFGPAYKGIPLVCATTIALSQRYQKNVPFCFNRKEIKDHGERGSLVGASLSGKIVMVDDVITAGITIRETIKLLKNHDCELSGILVAFDRQERGQHERSAIQEIVEEFNIPVQSIITLEDLIEFLNQQSDMRNHVQAMVDYQQLYGAK